MKTSHPEPPKDRSGIIIKVIVALLTLALLGGLGALAGKLILKVSSDGAQAPADKERLLPLAEKLEQAGLKDKAIKQYETYLQSALLPASQSVPLYIKLAELNIDLHDCREAMVWLFKAELADEKIKDDSAFQTHKQTCRQQIDQSLIE